MNRIKKGDKVLVVKADSYHRQMLGHVYEVLAVCNNDSNRIPLLAVQESYGGIRLIRVNKVRLVL